ncbi:MAG: hypothetical protein SGJ27_29755 [Candidatus Melainabacteria bacterium]|nr:hypothetical protein [Candidatus Melainabacteria bacterium]
MRYLFVIALLLTCLAPPVVALPLQGGITEDVIQAVPEQYRPGQYFDPRSLEKSKSNFWVPVPTWAAGLWTRTTELIEFPDGHRESKPVKSSTSWGAQTDGMNTVWHCYPLPAVGVGVGGGEKCYSIWMSQNYDPPRADMLRYSGDGMSITVDERTGIIKQVVQSKAIKTLTPNADGTITSSSVEGVYDEFGKRQLAFRGMTRYYRTGNYAPRNDLFPSFVNYLKANGYSDRIPNGAANAMIDRSDR